MPKVVPSQFPDCLYFLSASKPTIRPSREDKLNRKKPQDIVETIYLSKKKFQTQKELDLWQTLENLKKKFSLNDLWKKC